MTETGSKDRIARAAGAISAATLISRVLGYVKDMILARYFGAGALSDVFFVAFRIPNLLRELFAEGVMSSAFIPVITEVRKKEGERQVRRLVRSGFIAILILVGALCAAGIALTPLIVSLIAPGFSDQPAKFADTVLLTRIMFPFLLFISLASLAMGTLNARGVFFIPALAPALLNIVTIFSVIFLFHSFENPLVSVALGVTAGGLVQFLFQVPSLLAGMKERVHSPAAGCPPETPVSSEPQPFFHPALRRVGILMIPTIAGMAVSQINIFVGTIIASYLPGGSITFLYYAMRLIQFPIGIFGVAMGMAVLPALSEHAVRGNRGHMRDDVTFALRLLFFITLPATAGLVSLRVPIVSVLFERGAFDRAATTGTAEALLYYSIGIIAIVGTRILSSAFYALQDTKTPVKAAAAGVFVNVAASLLLMEPLGHAGIALANSAAAFTTAAILFMLLTKRLDGFSFPALSGSLIRTLAASSVLFSGGALISDAGIWESGSALVRSLLLIISVSGCAGAYFGVSLLLKSEELRYSISRLKRRKA